MFDSKNYNVSMFGNIKPGYERQMLIFIPM